ncbi:VWA domain-containing protein [Treponema sp. OMZ 805]|nr:vWA domain-containing protein [Treponema vincentii]
MLKVKSIFCILVFCILSYAVFAGERTIPVDVFLMIDKSQSMNEPGKFDSLHKWVRDTLVTEMLIPEDWITVWEFYEKPHELQTLVIKNENDRNTLIKTIDNITPNGAFTDIGSALDAIQASLNKRGKNNRYKILLLVTDLEQDAPWTSKYRGKQESFKSPYLAEARIIKHDNWYEITLDMDIQDKVVKTTKELYTNIIDNRGVPRSNDDQNKVLITEEKK